MLEKELLMAASAYNFVRAVTCLAARQIRSDPVSSALLGF
jgi:hypothetical protein